MLSDVEHEGVLNILGLFPTSHITMYLCPMSASLCALVQY